MLIGFVLDLGELGRRVIREEYLNALNFSDGDIFRHLRYCSLRNERSGRVKWLSRLSESKRRDLRQLERFADPPAGWAWKIVLKLFRYDGLIIPEALWDHVLYTGQSLVAGKTRRLGRLGGQIPTDCYLVRFAIM